jgi:hypothetical protein
MPNRSPIAARSRFLHYKAYPSANVKNDLLARPSTYPDDGLPRSQQTLRLTGHQPDVRGANGAVSLPYKQRPLGTPGVTAGRSAAAGPIEVSPPATASSRAREDHWHDATPNRFITHLPGRNSTTRAAPSRSRARHRPRRTTPPSSDRSARHRARGVGVRRSQSSLNESTPTRQRRACSGRLPRARQGGGSYEVALRASKAGPARALSPG